MKISKKTFLIGVIIVLVGWGLFCLSLYYYIDHTDYLPKETLKPQKVTQKIIKPEEEYAIFIEELADYYEYLGKTGKYRKYVF